RNEDRQLAPVRLLRAFGHLERAALDRLRDLRQPAFVQPDASCGGVIAAAGDDEHASENGKKTGEVAPGANRGGESDDRQRPHDRWSSAREVRCGTGPKRKIAVELE